MLSVESTMLVHSVVAQTPMAIDILQRLPRTFINEAGYDWETFLPSLEFAYNDSGSSHGYMPFELEYGRHPSTLMALALGISGSVIICITRPRPRGALGSVPRARGRHSCVLIRTTPHPSPRLSK